MMFPGFGFVKIAVHDREDLWVRSDERFEDLLAGVGDIARVLNLGRAVAAVAIAQIRVCRDDRRAIRVLVEDGLCPPQRGLGIVRLSRRFPLKVEVEERVFAAREELITAQPPWTGTPEVLPVLESRRTEVL